jgi:hypothetical protein
MNIKPNIISVLNSRVPLAIAITLVILAIVRKFFHTTYDPREPPVIPHWLPYIGHVIGMFRHGAKYFTIIKCVSNTTFEPNS